MGAGAKVRHLTVPVSVDAWRGWGGRRGQGRGWGRRHRGRVGWIRDASVRWGRKTRRRASDGLMRW